MCIVLIISLNALKIKLLNVIVLHVVDRKMMIVIFLILGDHGGDSQEELSAALYMFSKKNFYKTFNGDTTSVNQVSVEKFRKLSQSKILLHFAQSSYIT